MDGLVRKMGIGIGWDIDNSGLVKANDQTDGLVDSAGQGSRSFKGLSNAGLMAGNTIRRAFDGAKNAISSGINRLKDMRYQLAGMAAAGAAAITQSVFSAGDAQETINKFNVVFGEVSSQTREWADEYSDQIGRSKYATYGWLNSFQDVLVPMGLARDEAAGLSKEMVTLAADLGSFNNVATADAARSMQSALVGNHEAVKGLGIQLNENRLDSLAAAEGYNKNFRELDALTKMQLRFQEMTRQSSDAVGDATRTSDELNNQWLRFKGNIDVLNKGMGFGFIPTFRRGLILVNEFLETIKGSDKLKTAAKILGIATAVVGLGAAIGFAAAAWSAIGGFFTLTNFAVAGALIGLVLIIEDLWVGFKGGESAIFNAIDWFLDLIGVGYDMADLVPHIVAGWNRGFDSLKNIVLGFVKMIYNTAGLVTGAILSLFTLDFSYFKDQWSGFIDSADQFLQGLLFGWWDNIKGWFTDTFDFGGLIRSGLESAIDMLPGFLQEKVGGLLGFEGSAEDEIEREAQATQSQIQNNRSVNSRINVGEIKVEAADNPEETGRAVRKELETFLGMEAAEAGVG